MTVKKQTAAVLGGIILSVCVMSASLTALLLTGYYQRAHFQALGALCQDMADAQPDSAQTILSALKKCSLSDETSRPAYQKNRLILTYGYQPGDFLKPARRHILICISAGFLAGISLFFSALIFWRRREDQRIRDLTGSLAKWNPGGGRVLSLTGEDEFSKLQDEICKTVTQLYQTRDAALQAKHNYAENLFNIAHQLRTPITAISLAAQMMKPESSCCPGQIMPESSCLPGQIRRQLSRLTRLEESLLLLARMDAGTLTLEQKDTDVFTVLMLAADNLLEICREAEVTVTVPEAGEVSLCADPDWTVEAVMNLMKNCVEHTPPKGMVQCSYEQNPLYTLIRISDTGDGFAKEDIPHLFERFYRGQNAKGNGNGIGLSLSLEIIERQNGVVSAYNLPGRGACFEIRFYKSPMG